MGIKDFLNKLSGAESTEGVSGDYLELDEGGEFVQFDTPSRYVRVCKLKGFADIDISARELSEGNIVIIDIKPLADRSMNELKHAVEEMREICISMGGDIAGITEYHLILTPPNVKIERSESRGDSFEKTIEKVRQK
ncbi:MAG: cell division protein SepF [Candidatus Hydrothermarchaeaceae archaeon]